jgi:hypothetical protein
MKIVITENKLEKVLKQSGTKKTIELLGGWENFCKVFKIESPMDFLHLFDDLEQVQSEEKKNLTLFRYKKGYNYIVYDRKNEEVYINNVEILMILLKTIRQFDTTYTVTQEVLKKWLGEVHNLKYTRPTPKLLPSSMKSII